MKVNTHRAPTIACPERREAPRLREIIDGMETRLNELAKHSAASSTDVQELAALVGRLAAAHELEDLGRPGEGGA